MTLLSKVVGQTPAAWRRQDLLRRSRQQQFGVSFDAQLSPTASFCGRLVCDGSVRLEGLYEGGSIETLGNVIITSTARVIADIKAHTVSVAGAVEGRIEAQRVELLDGGKVWGEVHVDEFLLDDGGFIDGRLVIRGAEEPVPPSKETASPASSAHDGGVAVPSGEEADPAEDEDSLDESDQDSDVD
jgi:cytoskeletal protein CcmA (bactofilin family)